MSGDTHAHRQDGLGGGDEVQGWRQWRERRVREVTAPHGQLSVTGTHWFDGVRNGTVVVEGVPGRWTVVENGRAVELEAHVTDGLAVDGSLLVGRARLEEDTGPPAATRTSYGERRLKLMRREGQWGMRVFDPASATRRAFTGIDAFPYDPAWVLSGTFLPYPEGSRALEVAGTDGREYVLRLDGELGFAGPDGAEYVLHAARTADGGLQTVFADGTSGVSAHRFRFLATEPPAAFGAVTLDFNRTALPPCAFTDHYPSPVPPPDNTLPFDVRAGEQRLSGH